MILKKALPLHCPPFQTRAIFCPLMCFRDFWRDRQRLSDRAEFLISGNLLHQDEEKYIYHGLRKNEMGRTLACLALIQSIQAAEDPVLSPLKSSYPYLKDKTWVQKVKAALHTRSQPIKLTVSHSRRRGGSQVRNFSKVASNKRRKNVSRILIYDLSGIPGERK